MVAAADLSMDEAVRELGHVAAALEGGVAGVLGSAESLSRRIRLRELQAAFVAHTLLAKKARDLFLEYFDAPADGGAQQAGPKQQQQQQQHGAGQAALQQQTQQEQLQQAARTTLASTPLGFCWLLFCTARSVLLPQQADLVSSFALLLACTSWMLQHMTLALQRGSSSGAASAGVSGDEQLVALAVSHGAADHVATVRQLSDQLQQFVGQALLPAVVGGGAGGGGAPGPDQPADHAAAAAPAGRPSLFDAAGRPHPALLAALLQQYERDAGGADLDPFSFLAHAPRGGGAAAPRPATAQAGAAAMEMDAGAAGGSGAAAPEPAGPAAHEGSPEGARTPPRKRPGSAAHHPGSPAACNGQATAFRDASFHTPSPAKRRPPPQPQPPPATPISAALGSTAWLRGTVAAQPEGPSEGLQALMVASRVDAGQQAALASSAQAMAAAVFAVAPGQRSGPLLALDESTMAARRSEGVRLYWRTLEGLLAAEGSRPSASPGAAASLLASPLFLRCVAACAFEVVVAAYRMGGLPFPAVLERLRLPAFELCKVLEPFVLQLPTLPRDLMRHMLSVEERCLESLAWAPGSSFYTALAAAVGPLPPRPESPPAAVAPGQPPGSLTPRKRGLSEMAEGPGGEGAGGGGGDVEMAAAAAEPPPYDPRPRLPLSLGSETAALPPSASAGSKAAAGGGSGEAPGATLWQHRTLAARGDRSARAAVGEFLRRLLKLAAIRLADLLSRLDTHPLEPHRLLAEAYTLAEHVAFEHTWLLYGRHADQAMLCCLYAVCKVHSLEGSSFRAIIAAYRRQPQAKPDVYASVSLTPREATTPHLTVTQRGDLVAFYNQVFMPALKPFLTRLADNRSLLAQPPACALSYLQQHAGGAAGGAEAVPPPPPLHVRGAAQTPCMPAPLGGGLASPRATLGTPRGAMQLLSPGAWRINRGGALTALAPLPSPRIDQMASLSMAGSPGVRAAPPLSMAAIHHQFGLPGSGGAPGSLPSGFVPPPPATSAAAALAAASTARAVAGPLVPVALVAVPVAPTADVLRMFAGAEAAAAAAAAASAAQPAQQQQQEQQQQQQQQAKPAGHPAEAPAESLPLEELAAAAAAAEEMERRESEAAAAFAPLAPPAAQPAAPASGPAAPAVGAAALPPPGQPPQAGGAPQRPRSPRHARRILALQPAAAPFG